MSIAFNGSNTDPGIIQYIEDELGFNRGDISGDTTLMARFTGYINLSLDEVRDLESEYGIFSNPDDYNHTTHPIFDANVVATQRDYTIDEDTAGNKITGITKVQYNGKTLTPGDQQGHGTDNDFWQNGATGSPTHVDITGNAFFVWPTPDTSVTGGFTIFADREGSYFTTSDTTKTPGYSNSHHYFSVIAPCEMYTRMNTISNHKDFVNEKFVLKEALRNSISRKARLKKPRLNANVTDTR